MTQEEKELLLKDLCSRLPYGVKGVEANTLCLLDTVTHFKSIVKTIEYKIEHLGFKPYLFPLSSMTEEQRKEIAWRYNYHNYYGLCIEITNHSNGYWDDDDSSCHLQDYLWLVDWYNKNHFDYRGLIPKGLALDATGLNIY